MGSAASSNKPYIITPSGILRICEIAFSLAAVISAAVVSPFGIGPVGYLFFTSILTMLIGFAFFILHITNTMHRLPGPWVLIEFITFAVLEFFNVIAFIVAAATTTYYKAGISATIFFLFISIVMGVDLYFLYANWRINGNSGHGTQPGPAYPAANTYPATTTYPVATSYPADNVAGGAPYPAGNDYGQQPSYLPPPTVYPSEGVEQNPNYGGYTPA